MSNFSKLVSNFVKELNAFDEAIRKKYSTVYGTYGEVIRNNYDLSKPCDTVNVLAVSFYNKEGRIIGVDTVPDSLTMAHNDLIFAQKKYNT